MEQGWYIGVVIPARDEAAHIRAVIETLPSCVDMAIVINDGSLDQTEVEARSAKAPCPLTIISTSGEGVGASINRGHQFLLEQLPKPFVSVVMAGDGQMNPEDLQAVIQPIIFEQADYVKGNRKKHLKGYNAMPFVRKAASTLLGFFTSLASGQSISDPQCGFTATSSRVLGEWDWSSSWKGYGYPNYWLIRLAQSGWRIGEVPVHSIYRNEVSGIKNFSFFIKVGLMMAIEHHKRNFSWLVPPTMIFSSFLAFIAYAIGWCLLLNATLIKIDMQLTMSTFSYSIGTLGCWSIAHIFDRFATRRRKEMRKREAI